MATQARITLVALNGDAPSLPQRTILLHPDFRTIQVGRASKSPSKGLQAAVDNAWFDSPVMSRNHAEIFLDADSVYVKDIGSMHGTFINETQLNHDEPSQLSNGDILVLGAEVKRNSETFPACVFQVRFEVFPFKTTNSYAFPESDEEEDVISDDDMDRIEEPSSEDGVSIMESPPHKVSQAIEAIDLTRDDSPTILPIAEGDSDGQTRAEKNIMNTLAGHATDINHNADAVSIAVYNAVPPILIDSEDEDAHFSSDSDNQSDDVEYGDGASTSEGESMRSHEDSDIEDDEEVEDVGKAYGDEESDFGLSDTGTAGAAGIRALFEDGLIDNDTQRDPWNDENDDEGVESDSGRANRSEMSRNGSYNEERIETPKHVTFASFGAEQLPETASSFAQFNKYQRTFADLNVPSTSASARQPSPSDAAMVKTVKPTSTAANQTIAQSLGNKSGKHAFFAAREGNKARLNASENLQPASWSQDLVEAKQREVEERLMATKEQPKVFEAQRLVLPSLATLPYLEDPTQGPRAARTPSPEFDMTSAVTFNESKASMAASSKHVTGRSALRINDIIEGAAGDRPASSLKRKADDMSETIENEVRVWASSSAALDTAPGTSFASPAVVEEQPKTVPAPISFEHRPAKRLRKIVESVGYVALGGATLFGALVLSAPDFL